MKAFSNLIRKSIWNAWQQQNHFLKNNQKGEGLKFNSVQYNTIAIKTERESLLHKIKLEIKKYHPNRDLLSFQFLKNKRQVRMLQEKDNKSLLKQ